MLKQDRKELEKRIAEAARISGSSFGDVAEALRPLLPNEIAEIMTDVQD